ncbi:MAG: zf-TFIIB domain-containing protein [Kofleriaceae bacterium]|nr:zf-TFIIB domain-containing protein [Kofleriaceae bacterium]
MDDPYRSGQQSGMCPRCGTATESDGELGRLACRSGCGEWYPRAAFERAWLQITQKPSSLAPDGTHPQASAWPWGAASCPVCHTGMSTGFRGDVRFDFCHSHGVWLDAGEISRFAQVFELS